MPEVLTPITSEVQVCNLALDLVKEPPITTLDDNRASARWMKRNYAPTRDYVMAAHPWKFLMKRASIAEDPTAPAFGWSRRFALPSDNLRVMPLRYKGDLNGALLEHEVESGFILTDAATPLLVSYIARKDNVADFANTPLFVEALTTKLAARCAHWLSGKQSLVEGNEARFKETLVEARYVESTQGSHPDQYANAYEQARNASSVNSFPGGYSY